MTPHHIASVCAALALLAGPVAAQTLPETSVTVIGNLGITTQSQLLEEPFWTEEVTEASGGAITGNFRTWNEMGLKGPEIFGLLSEGVMNIATAQLGHHSGAAPMNDGTDLAGLSTSFEEFRAVSDAFFPELAGYYREELGLELLTLQSYQSQIMYCRDEITGLTDLDGRRVRTSGASQGEFVAHFGGSGVDVAFGEVQQALEQGVVDCAITGTLGGYSARWYEAANYLYVLPVNFGAGATAANGEWWDGQPVEVQNFLRTQISDLSDRMWALNAEENAIGIACNTTGPCPLGEPGGMTLVTPSEADLDLRREALVQSVLPGWISRCGDVCRASYESALVDITGIAIE